MTKTERAAFEKLVREAGLVLLYVRIGAGSFIRESLVEKDLAIAVAAAEKALAGREP